MEKKEEFCVLKAYLDSTNQQIRDLRAAILIGFGVGFVTFLKISKKISRLESDILAKNLE